MNYQVVALRLSSTPTFLSQLNNHFISITSITCNLQYKLHWFFILNIHHTQMYYEEEARTQNMLTNKMPKKIQKLFVNH
jgi:hypothetical protein